MRFLMILFALCFAFSHNAFAEDRKTPQTRIVTDEKAGDIIFIVEGNKVAVLDENGMTVFGRVNYGAGQQDQTVATDAKPGDATNGAAHD